MTGSPGRRAFRPPLAIVTEWHSRGRVPHWEAGEVPQSINFRLADSLPRDAVERALRERTSAAQRERFEAFLDAGHGESLLARPAIGAIVEKALLKFDAVRYRLHAWCVMPNHVHALATPMEDVSLSSIVHSWKSFTAKAINAEVGRRGRVWFEEYFDRAVRNIDHYDAAVAYIEANPVIAGLCAEPEDWPFSSAREGRNR
jgi:REP element-mobilizing transposase RayT